jgi:hypothetical protein
MRGFGGSKAALHFRRSKKGQEEEVRMGLRPAFSRVPLSPF